MGFFSKFLAPVAGIAATVLGGPAVGAIATKAVGAIARRPRTAAAAALGGAALVGAGSSALASGGPRRRRRRRSARLTVREQNGLMEIEHTFGKASDAARYAKRRLAARIIRAL